MVRDAQYDDMEFLLTMMEDFNRLERVPFEQERTRPALTRLIGDRALGRVLLIEDGPSVVVGYLVMTYGYDLEFNGRDAFLTEVYLRPEFRRRGLATEALTQLDRIARQDGASAIHLGVYPDNERALALYRRAGFSQLPRVFYSKTLV